MNDTQTLKLIVSGAKLNAVRELCDKWYGEDDHSVDMFIDLIRERIGTGFFVFDDYCGAGTTDGRICKRVRPAGHPYGWRCHDHKGRP